MNCINVKKFNRPAPRNFDALVETIDSTLDSTLNRSLARKRLNCCRERGTFAEMYGHPVTGIASCCRLKKNVHTDRIVRFIVPPVDLLYGGAREGVWASKSIL